MMARRFWTTVGCALLAGASLIILAVAAQDAISALIEVLL